MNSETFSLQNKEKRPFSISLSFLPVTQPPFQKGKNIFQKIFINIQGTNMVPKGVLEYSCPFQQQTYYILLEEVINQVKWSHLALVHSDLVSVLHWCTGHRWVLTDPSKGKDSKKKVPFAFPEAGAAPRVAFPNWPEKSLSSTLYKSHTSHHCSTRHLTWVPNPSYDRVTGLAILL